MMEMSFLRDKLYADKGIFDNQRIYENTISAFERALKHGFPIRVDVRILLSGEIICFSDDSMDRLLHLEGKIEKLTFEDLEYISKYHIAKFDEVLNLIGGKVPLLIYVHNNGVNKYLIPELVNLMNKYNGEYAYESDSIRVLKALIKNKVNVPLGYVLEKKNFGKTILFKNYNFMDAKVGLCSKKYIKHLRNGKMLLGSGIDGQNEYDEFKLFYDNFIVNNILDINN